MTATASARPSNEQRIRAALWFAQAGFAVFPVWSADQKGYCRCPKGPGCDNAGKHPMTPNGLKDATTDEQRIRTMLSAGSDPNYGMLCPDGVFALDVDQDDRGIARLAELEAELGALPPTLRTETANGQHVFLRWPGDHPRPLHKMFGYVTRWGSGASTGYVIGPRSVHRSGKEYQPAGGTTDIAELPAAWVARALEGDQTIRVGATAGELPQVGGRHDWLRDRARYFRGFMDSPVTLRAAMLAENARLPQPKTDEEVDRAIGEVFARFPADPPAEAAEHVDRKLGESDDDLDLLGPPPSGQFPEAPATVAFAGFLGELVDDLADGTDASLVGLLGSLVAFCGALVPGQAYFHRLQTSSPFVALVGESSVGRKGTAMNRVQDAVADAVGIDTVNRAVLDGVNSGEGLVTALHYKQENFKYEPTVGLMFEEEYASLLASRARDGSTLDPRMRSAFDGSSLSNRKAGETKTVTPPYWLPALIGITPSELRQRLEPGALQSGSANRWVYLPVVRRDRIPSNSEPRFHHEHRRDLLAARKRATEHRQPLGVHPAVTRTLAEYADFLPTVSHGLARDLTRRLAIIAFRLALVHALVEQETTVEPEHLERAIALTEYARAGIAWVFGDTIGNPDADLLFRHLQQSGRLRVRAITRSVIRDPIRRQAAIDELTRLGRARVVSVHSGAAGRPRVELQYIDEAESKVAFRGDFVHLVHVTANSTPTNAENVDKMDKMPVSNSNGTGQNADKIVTQYGQNATKSPATDGPPEVPLVVDKTVTKSPTGWCHFFADHQSRHRDVSADPWCEICSPRAGGAA